MNKRLYLCKGDRVLYGYSRSQLVEAIVARVNNHYHLISLEAGSDLGELKDEGWYPKRGIAVASIELTKFNICEIRPTTDSVWPISNTYQKELVEYFG